MAHSAPVGHSSSQFLGNQHRGGKFLQEARNDHIYVKDYQKREALELFNRHSASCVRLRDEGEYEEEAFEKVHWRSSFVALSDGVIFLSSDQ